MLKISRRKLLKLAGAAPIVSAFSSAWMSKASAADKKTITAVMQSDLRVIDPLFTTAYITRDHGYMIYDTLLATDSSFKVQPQMADWKVSDDKLTYTFTLRDGLKWHDGAPVTAEDCVASLKRWGRVDNMGQKLMDFTASIEAADAKTIVLKLKEPYGLVLESIAKPSSYVAFMMPKRLAETPAGQQMAEQIGSGPFKFVKAEFQPGVKAVYEKNPDYVPRKEPPSWTAGGKVVKVDRVEWLYIPDPQTAANALGAGEVDWWQQLPQDLVPSLAKNKDVTVTSVDPLGSVGVLRFNHELPPFDNPKMRQAVEWVIDQKEIMTALAGDKKYWKTCYSYFSCGTPLANDAANAPLAGKRDVEKAKALVKEAGYAGEKVVVMTATDQPIVNAQALVVMEALKKIGINAELAAMDWGTLITRRASHEPIDKGGWNIFFTWFVAPDMASPALNAALRGNGANAWFGWPKDPKIESLRDQWFAAPDLAAQKKIAEEIQTEAFESVPYVPTGMFEIPTAYRSNLKGVIVAPVVFLWNVEKS